MASPSTEPMSAQVPTPALDHSRLELELSTHTRIGVGVHGTVHFAHYFGEPVAVKHIPLPRLPGALSNDPYIRSRRTEALHRFVCDIQQYETVSHPGIVRFLGVTAVRDASAALLLSELMYGGSLADALHALRQARKPMKMSSIAQIALQACGGLRALHSAGCIWGDAKPENVLLSDCIDSSGGFPATAEARISNIGLCGAVERYLLSDTTAGASDQPLGSYNYAAPETFRSLGASKTTKAVDMFSFGLVLYETITLRIPWRRRQLTEVCELLSSGKRPAWPCAGDEDYYGPLPSELISAVESCWAQDPYMRPSIDVVFATLEKFSNRVNHEPEQGSISGSLGRSPTPQTGLAQIGTVNMHLIQCMCSKDSSTSTAIAIGESVSIDLPCSGSDSSALSSSVGGLVSTRESFRDCGQNDYDSELYDTEMELKVPRSSEPKVSPVTSPERCSLNFAADARVTRGISSGSEAKPVAVWRAVDAISNGRSRDILTREISLTEVKPDRTSYVPQTRVESPTGMQGRRELLLGLALPGEPVTRVEDKQLMNTVSSSQARCSRDNLSTADICCHVTCPLKVEASQIHTCHLASELAKRTNSWCFEGTSVTELSLNRSLTAPALRRTDREPKHINRASACLEQRANNTGKRRVQQSTKEKSEEATMKAMASARSSGNFSLILEEMKKNRNSPSIARTGTVYLDACCSNEELYYNFCEEGGLEEILSSAVQFGKSDSALCCSFCSCITSLATHYDSKVGHLLRALGAPVVIIEVLGYHRTVVEVQTAGCNSLAAIARHSELSRSAVATLGGPSAVYKALTQNNVCFRDIELARSALKAIHCIAQDNELAAQYLVDVVALDAVSRSAHVFPDAGLERDILLALQSFTFYNGGRRNVIMSSGLKAVTEIMLRNREPGFLVSCCTFVREVAQWRDIECEEAMLRSCIAERITALMEHTNLYGEESARVSWYACQACIFLASFGTRSRERLRLVGAVDKAVSLLRFRKENARVVKCATDALRELTKGELAAIIHAKRCGAVSVLSAALDLHAHNLRVRNSLQSTIDCLLTAPSHSPKRNNPDHNLLPSGRAKIGSILGGNDKGGRPRRGFGGFMFWQNAI